MTTHAGRPSPKNVHPHMPRTVGVVVYALPSKQKLVALTVVDDFAGLPHPG